MIEALTKSRGLISVAARALKCTRGQIYERMKADPAVKEAVDAARDLTVDVAEAKLFQAVQAGEPWAITLILKGNCLGRERGYGERVELAGDGGGPVEVNIVDARTKVAERLAAIGGRMAHAVPAMNGNGNGKHTNGSSPNGNGAHG